MKLGPIFLGDRWGPGSEPDPRDSPDQERATPAHAQLCTSPDEANTLVTINRPSFSLSRLALCADDVGYAHDARDRLLPLDLVTLVEQDARQWLSIPKLGCLPA